MQVVGKQWQPTLARQVDGIEDLAGGEPIDKVAVDAQVVRTVRGQDLAMGVERLDGLVKDRKGLGCFFGRMEGANGLLAFKANGQKLALGVQAALFPQLHKIVDRRARQDQTTKIGL